MYANYMILCMYVHMFDCMSVMYACMYVCMTLHVHVCTYRICHVYTHMRGGGGGGGYVFVCWLVCIG